MCPRKMVCVQGQVGAAPVVTFAVPVVVFAVAAAVPVAVFAVAAAVPVAGGLVEAVGR